MTVVEGHPAVNGTGKCQRIELCLHSKESILHHTIMQDQVHTRNESSLKGFT